MHTAPIQLASKIYGRTRPSDWPNSDLETLTVRVNPDVTLETLANKILTPVGTQTYQGRVGLTRPQHDPKGGRIGNITQVLVTNDQHAYLSNPSSKLKSNQET